MDLPETIESINEKLAREFGYVDGRLPKYRVVFSDDEREKRLVQHTPEGLELIYPVVVDKPKYKHYIQSLYILEKFFPVVGESDLVEKYSYEPLWVFRDKNGNYLPPKFWPCKFLIEFHYDRQRLAQSYTQYKENYAEVLEKEVKEVEEMLFGDETSTTDSLTYKEGIVVPNKEWR
jgi:hypothetical protein